MVVVCDYASQDELKQIASICRRNKVPIILGEVASLYGRILVDLGELFTVVDKDGEAVVEIKIDTIETDGTILLAKGQKHSL